MKITPEIEARLEAEAAQRGLTPEQTIAALSTDQEEMVAALRASEEDHEAGRSMSLEEYKTRMMARRQERNAAKDNP